MISKGRFLEMAFNCLQNILQFLLIKQIYENRNLLEVYLSITSLFFPYQITCYLLKKYFKGLSFMTPRCQETSFQQYDNKPVIKNTYSPFCYFFGLRPHILLVTFFLNTLNTKYAGRNIFVAKQLIQQHFFLYFATKLSVFPLVSFIKTNKHIKTYSLQLPV